MMIPIDLLPMFFGAEGSFSTPLLVEYTPYVDTKIVVNDTSVLPDAPNLVTIYSPSDPKHFCVLKYMSKTDTVLSDLIVMYGHPNPAVKFKIGSFASRKYTVYDHDTFVKNITMMYDLLIQIVKDSDIVKVVVKTFTLSIPNIVTVGYVPTNPQSFIHSESYSSYITSLIFEQPNGIQKLVEPSADNIAVEFDNSTMFAAEGRYAYTLTGTDITGKTFSGTAPIIAANYGYIGATPNSTLRNFNGLAVITSGETRFNVPTIAGDYVWVCLIDGTTLVEMTSAGFSVPMQPPVIVSREIDGNPVSYNCYRTTERLVTGDNTFTIIVSTGPIVITPTIDQFSISIPSVVDIGSSFVGTYTLTHKESYTDYIDTLEFIQPNGTRQDVTPVSSSTTVDFASNIVFDTVGTYTYRLRGIDTNGNELLKQITVSTITNGWIGVSADNPLRSIEGFQQTNLGTHNYTLSSNDGDYIWVCLNGGQELTDLTSFGFAIPYVEAGTFDFISGTNVITYNCWRSAEAIIGGSNTFVATIEDTGYGAIMPHVETFSLDTPKVVDVGYHLVGPQQFSHSETHIDKIESLTLTQPNGITQAVVPSETDTIAAFDSDIQFNERKTYIYTLSGIDINGNTFSKSDTISTITDGWVGASADNPLTSLVGFVPFDATETNYSIPTENGDYFWFCMGAGYSVVSVTSAGFGVPIERAGTFVDTSGAITKTYNCWKSTEQLIGGSNNIVITIRSN